MRKTRWWSSLALARGRQPVVDTHRGPSRLRGYRRDHLERPLSHCLLSQCLIAACLGCSSGEEVAPRVEQTVARPALGIADRQHLWQVEHHGGLLREFGWRTMADALMRGDRDTMRRCLSDDFQGTLFSEHRSVDDRRSGSLPVRTPSVAEPSRAVVATDTLDEQFGLVRSRRGSQTESINADGLVDWLLALISGFDRRGLEIKFHLMSVKPEVPSDLERDWSGNCKLVIQGQRGSTRPGSLVIEFDFVCGQPRREILEAGDWLRQWNIQRMEAARSDSFLMREVAAERGLNGSRFHDNWKSDKTFVQTGGVYLLDHNRDGYLDVVVTDKTTDQGLFLYECGPGGQFHDVTRQLGIPPARGCRHAAIADLDGDGWEDLFLPGRMVLRNQQGQGFVDVTDQSNLNWLLRSRSTNLALGGVSGVSIADYDRDGLLDLYITRADVSNYNVGTWVDGRGGDIWGNQLLRNQGGWRFEDVTHSSGTLGGNRSVFSSVWLDADNNGSPDLYLIHEFGHGVLLLNSDDGTFRELEFAARAQDYGSMGLGCGDINNDGWIDVYVASMYSKAGNRIIDNVPAGAYDRSTMAKFRRMVTGSQLHLNRGGLRFDPAGAQMHVEAVGWAWAPALVDLNNDGWLDIYATCGFMSRARGKPDG